MEFSPRLCYVTMMAAFAVILAAAHGSDGQVVPDAHLKIENPRALDAEGASAAYRSIIDIMRRNYAAAEGSPATDYLTWRRYNAAPYLSPTHGNRYVNHYGNAEAAGYGRLTKGQSMPPGAVLAKDSFTVTEDGQILAAPLFVMAKLADGASPDTADWRYLMLLPGGSIFGDSAGDGTERVAFCHQCHLRAIDTDHLFYLPRSVPPAD